MIQHLPLSLSVQRSFKLSLVCFFFPPYFIIAVRSRNKISGIIGFREPTRVNSPSPTKNVGLNCLHFLYTTLLVNDAQGRNCWVVINCWASKSYCWSHWGPLKARCSWKPSQLCRCLCMGSEGSVFLLIKKDGFLKAFCRYWSFILPPIFSWKTPKK